MNKSWVVMDRHADTSHAGRVRHRQVIGIVKGNTADGFELAALMQLERAVNRSNDFDPVEPVGCVADFSNVFFARRIDNDPLIEAVAGDREAREAPNVAAYLANGRAESAKGAGFMGQSDLEGC